MSSESKCPFIHPGGVGTTNQDWWPHMLDVDLLHRQPDFGAPNKNFDYAKAFNSLDLDAVKKDLHALMTDSQEWWPADFGHYGGLFLRMSWHAAGTYRTRDGRGGAAHAQQRFPPICDWPDNVNLDKARRLLWPIKQKYGSKISWGDLMMLTGTVAIESMGVPSIGFGGGRTDSWEYDGTDWGAEREWFTNDKRFYGERFLEQPLSADTMGLIYVNPQGPNGNPDPLGSAHDIRITFGRMGMDDYETVALIAGGHTFGKTHGAAPESNVGPEPQSAPISQQHFGWKNKFGTGKGDDTITSGIEVIWSQTPTKFSTYYFDNLLDNEWEKTTSPAGAHQWTPKNPELKNSVPDPHNPHKRRTPGMLTSDIALKVDPEYRKICERFHKDPEEFKLAFARAWYKLIHRDMGPRALLLGKHVPHEEFIWQDPIPVLNHPVVNESDIEALKKEILGSGLTITELVFTAWASASTFRGSDKRGGANGARIRLAPQKDWEINQPQQLAKVLKVYESIQDKFNKAQTGGKKVSLADLIVLGGSAAVEKAARNGGQDVEVPFTPGRMDASQEQTDAASFDVLEPIADGFRNYIQGKWSVEPEVLLIDRAQLLTLTAPEMTVLIGGLRALGANVGGTKYGVFSSNTDVLNNNFFKTLLNMEYEWKPTSDSAQTFEGFTRKSKQPKFTGTRVDLIFGAESRLRALSEWYAEDDSDERFVKDFVAAWTKVMNLDRFDVKHSSLRGNITPKLA